MYTRVLYVQDSLERQAWPGRWGGLPDGPGQPRAAAASKAGDGGGETGQVLVSRSQAREARDQRLKDRPPRVENSSRPTGGARGQVGGEGQVRHCLGVSHGVSRAQGRPGCSRGRFLFPPRDALVFSLSEEISQKEEHNRRIQTKLRMDAAEVLAQKDPGHLLRQGRP